MDDTKLVIQCEHAEEKGHQCTKETCGSLKAEGTITHATAIGNIITNRTIKAESGFSNLTIKGGIIDAKAGEHNCAIGAACGSYYDGAEEITGQYAKNICIQGGVITAKGGTLCAGIGGGKVTPVDGIYITGGTVYASGGEYSPGIGSGGSPVVGETEWEGIPEVFNVSNIVISGGNTFVKAVGDKGTDMPGIGCGKYGTEVIGTANNIFAVPDTGYQGYIQDGISETEYNFTAESPFQTKQDIKVDKYFTMVYFGPFRDENKINSETKEQLGANHIISKTGGKAFEETEIKELCGIKGKDKEGNNFKLEDFKIDEEQLKAINEAKTSKNTGKFPLTYETPDGEKVTVEVLLTGTVQISFDTNGGSKPPEMQSADSGKKVLKPEDPVREGYIFEGWYYTDKDGNETERNFEDPVYENMTLKARWKAVPRTEATEQTMSTTETKTESVKPSITEKAMPDWEYSKRKRTERTVEKTAKTGDETGSMFFLVLVGCSLTGAGFVYKKMR